MLTDRGAAKWRHESGSDGVEDSQLGPNFTLESYRWLHIVDARGQGRRLLEVTYRAMMLVCDTVFRVLVA